MSSDLEIRIREVKGDLHSKVEEEEKKQKMFQEKLHEIHSREGSTQNDREIESLSERLRKMQNEIIALQESQNN